MLISLPFCIGMLAAFFRAKSGGKGYYNERYSLQCNLLLEGYGAGNKFCILSFMVIAFIVTIFYAGDIPISSIIEGIIPGIIGFSFVSMILGVILYLPCAYIGSSFRSSQLAKEEIAKSQQQILKDIEPEKASDES